MNLTGINLILSTVCNVTSCEPSHVLPPVGFLSANEKTEMRATREMVNGKHFTVGTINDGVLSRIRFNVDGKPYGYGISFIIMKGLSEKLNFTYEMMWPPNHIAKRGKKVAESWLIEKLIDNKIDIAAAFISFTMDRKDLITFSLEVDTVNCIGMDMSNSRKRKVHRASVIKQPIHTGVWVMLLLTIILYVPTLVFLTRLRSKLIKDDEESFTLSSSLAYIYRVLTKQDVQQSPKASMTRILLITWSIFVFLIFTISTAHLARHFTLIGISQEELQKGRMKWYGDEIIDYHNLESCYSTTTINHFLKRPSGFAYPRNSNISTLFDKEIRVLLHTGYLDVIIKAYDAIIENVCPFGVNSNFPQINLGELHDLYLVYALSVSAAFVTFIIEILLKKFKKANDISAGQGQEIDTVQGDAALPPFEIPENNSSFQSTTVNGREYLIARSMDGHVRLIPVDTLSGLLFDMDLYEPV